MSIIDKIVRTTLDWYWDGNFPVDINTISKLSGVVPVVHYEEEECVETRIQYNTVMPSVTTANITTSIPLPMRTRFCTAHALGHVLLGHDIPSDKCCTVENFGLYGNKDELDANEFARKILVPKYAVQMVALKGYSFDAMCKLFIVSEVLLKKRMEEIIG